MPCDFHPLPLGSRIFRATRRKRFDGPAEWRRYGAIGFRYGKNCGAGRESCCACQQIVTRYRACTFEYQHADARCRANDFRYRDIDGAACETCLAARANGANARETGGGMNLNRQRPAPLRFSYTACPDNWRRSRWDTAVLASPPLLGDPHEPYTDRARHRRGVRHRAIRGTNTSAGAAAADAAAAER